MLFRSETVDRRIEVGADDVTGDLHLDTDGRGPRVEREEKYGKEDRGRSSENTEKRGHAAKVPQNIMVQPTTLLDACRRIWATRGIVLR